MIVAKIQFFISCITIVIICSYVSLCLFVKMTEITREMLVGVLDSKLEEKLKPIYQSIGEVKASLKFLSDKYDSADKRVSELEIKCQTVVQENTFLKAEVLRLSRSLDSVSKEMHNMSQYGRCDCCEISGLPVEHGKDTKKLEISLPSLMDLKLTRVIYLSSIVYQIIYHTDTGQCESR